MPEHSSLLTFALAYMKDTLEQNVALIGKTMIDKNPPEWTGFEPIIAMLLIGALVVGLAYVARAKLEDTDAAIEPEGELTLRTFFEVFLGYFYDLAKGLMDEERARKYFPVIGASALFVFFSNVMALIPGLPVPTSSLNVTLGCALVVFVLFNFYGIAANGWGYFKHLLGPVIWVAPLILLIELISLCVRPVTLSIRLMVNMAVDHLLLVVMLGMIPVLVPIPVQFLGVIIIVVQTLVFALLTTIYIALATEHEHEEHEH